MIGGGCHESHDVNLWEVDWRAVRNHMLQTSEKMNGRLSWIRMKVKIPLEWEHDSAEKSSSIKDR
jgi:hypothetical protein